MRDGEQLFADARLRVVPPPRAATPGRRDIAALADQTIHPYTDLLLHDMGPGLADDRPDGARDRHASGAPRRCGASASSTTVNGHTRFLHDGRARNLAEAILWHGGEAKAAKERFRVMSREDRDAIIAYLESL